MNPGNGIETGEYGLWRDKNNSFYLMNPGNGIETTKIFF